MGKMGASSLDKKTKKELSPLFSGLKGGAGDTEASGQREKREFQKGVRLTGTENDRFEMLKTALGTDKDATALLRCFEFVWEKCGPEIEEIAAKKEKMKVL